MKKKITMNNTSLVITQKGAKEASETIAIEKPYRILLNDREIGSSMLLETGLEEFGAGFLFGMGFVEHPNQVREVLVCPEGRISVHADVDDDIEPKDVVITSGCGGTGKISRDMLEGAFGELEDFAIGFDEAGQFIRQVLHASNLGLLTHCVHGCGFWSDGRLAAFYEDIGRHNAVDKVIGAILLGKITPKGAIYTTGRLTSDMVLKCARIGIPIVMSRTSASSLGLAIARRAGVTLISYARPGRLNVFNAPERIVK